MFAKGRALCDTSHIVTGCLQLDQWGTRMEHDVEQLWNSCRFQTETEDPAVISRLLP